MNITHTSTIYFSATGSTETIAQHISRQMDFHPGREINLTDREQKYASTEGELVVIAIPVFSGRVAPLIASRLENLSGNNTPAVLVAVYGNRHFDDALIELYDIVKSKGFVPIAAVAAVAEHSIVRSVASNRPNDKDLNQLSIYCESIRKHVYEMSEPEIMKNIPGKRPYKTYKAVPFHPHATNKCKECGICAEHCPANAIPKDEPKKTDGNKCISCMRCTKICPANARRLRLGEQLLASGMLMAMCKTKKEAELFF